MFHIFLLYVYGIYEIIDILVIMIQSVKIFSSSIDPFHIPKSRGSMKSKARLTMMSSTFVQCNGVF